MSIIQYTVVFILSAVSFVVIDIIWLAVVAKDLYRKIMGDILLDKFKLGPAFVFYILFILCLMYLVIIPAIEKESLSFALSRGAVFGFATYMTYNLTNYSVLKDYNPAIIPIDLIWGSTLAMLISLFTYLIYFKIY